MTSNRWALEGRRILIIGGGGAGVGHAITLMAAAAGAHVAVVDIDPDAARQVTGEAIRAGAGGAVAVAADMRRIDDCRRVVAEACSEMGGIDGYVASLGGLMAFNIPFVRLHEFNDEWWDTVFDLNLRYVFRTLSLVLKVMLEQESGGSIVTVGSDGGTAGHGSPLTAAYGAAKAGLAHLTKTVAVEYGADQIRANMVSPGPTSTTSVSGMNATLRDGMNAAIPLGRQGSPENVADAVVFLLGDTAAHISGQIIGVDGGLSVQRPMPSFSNIYEQR